MKWFLALLLVANLASGAPAHVQSTSNNSSSGTAHTLAYAGAVTVGSRLIGGCNIDSTSTIVSVADSVNGSWTVVPNTTNVTASTAKSMSMWTFISTAAGTPTVTFTMGHALIRYCVVAEYSNAANVLDSDTVDLAAGTSQTCTNSVATAAGDLNVAMLVMDTASTSIAPGGTETERVENTVLMQVQDKAAAGSGNQASTWTLGSAGVAGMCAQIVLGSAPTAAKKRRMRE